MADAFISYQSDDRAFAQTLAQRLGEQGFTVWHDQGMGADSEYYKQIAAELAAAKVVVALWSARSDNSRWVYSEADEADKANKLVNASIDGRIPPKPFDRLHCRDLSGWQGATSDDRYKSLLDDLRRVMSRRDGGPVAERSLPPDSAAARAWPLIQDETDPERYHQFLAVHGASPQAATARRHLDDIASWHALAGAPSRRKLAEIDQFILSGPFRVLGERAKHWRQETLEKVLRDEKGAALAEAQKVKLDFERGKSEFESEQRRKWDAMEAVKALRHAENAATAKRQAWDAANAPPPDFFDWYGSSSLDTETEFWKGPIFWLLLILWPVGLAMLLLLGISRAMRMANRADARRAKESADTSLKQAQAAADEAWQPFQRASDAFELKRPGA